MNKLGVIYNTILVTIKTTNNRFHVLSLHRLPILVQEVTYSLSVNAIRYLSTNGLISS